MSDTPKLDMPEIAESQASKYITHNEALRILDCLVQCTALSRDLIVPPASPIDGDTYIIGQDTDSTSGDWEGHDNEIAYYKSSAWIYIVPAEGWRVFVQDIGILYAYVPSKVASGDDPWAVEPGTEFEVHATLQGTPSSLQVLCLVPMTGPVNFPDDLAKSQGVAGTAATAETVFSIRKNGAQFAIMTFAAAGLVATFATSSTDENLAEGDILMILAPATPDATLANIGVSLRGIKL